MRKSVTAPHDWCLYVALSVGVALSTLPTCHPEPTKERVEPTTLSMTAIEIPHLTRFTLLLLLRT